MLKHSETIINSNVRRQDATWDYRWDFYNSDREGTIFERPDMDSDGTFGNETWYFCGEHDKLRQYDSSTWDPTQPVFEYEVQNPIPDGDDPTGQTGEGPTPSSDTWDSAHPYNPSRYLRPGDTRFMRITNTVQNVTIDTVPPEFVSDYGTEYLGLQGTYDGKNKFKDGEKIKFSKRTRDIILEFKDDVGLDYKQFAIYVGDKNIDWGNMSGKLDDDIIYYYDRTLDKPFEQDYVDFIKLQADTKGNYRINLQLNECWKNFTTGDTYSILNVLNTGETEEIELKVEDTIKTRKKYTKSRLNLIVWDLAGNYSIYHIVRPFNVLEIDDLNSLVPVNIDFIDIEPENFYIEEGIEGKIVTQVYDPNYILWEYENVAKLTEISIGLIDKGSYEADDNREHNPLDGMREFIITHLTESGNVEVEAWVETGFPEIDELIKERTYNTAICGPWVYGDEGRKYHITPYIPKYLRGTEFADFMEFFQLYINTMYQGMENNRNISGLEKIARIGNFNDIARLENTLVYHYANQFGNEFDFDVDSLQNVNLIFDGVGFTTKDIKETFDTIKYVLEELPAYNRYKGTNTGIALAIQMFGFTCKVINVWVQREHEIEVNPNFIEEDSLDTMNDYFITSRFNLDVGANTNTFKTFCDNIDMFIDLIKSIKPITKILNLIKYSINLSQDINFVYDYDILEDENSKELTYKLEWKFNKDNLKDVENVLKLCTLDKKTGTADLFCLSYKPAEAHCIKNGSEIPMPSMVYNVIGKLLKSKYTELILKIDSHKVIDNSPVILPISYHFDRNGITPMLNAGSFFLFFSNEEYGTGTNCYNMIKKFFDYDKLTTDNTDEQIEITIKMEFVLQNGTDYARCNNPS